MDIPWILVWILTQVTALEQQYKKCNQTISDLDLDSDTKVTFKHDASVVPQEGAAYTCWYRIHGNTRQYVEIEVWEVIAGYFDKDQCRQGYLRITDDDVEETSPRWLPPTTICGDYPADSIRVKRMTRGPSAFVEFHVDSADESQSFEFDAIFLDKEPEDDLPYGHIQRSAGKINNTLCDWLIAVDTCIDGCSLITPGYSGIYPPNIKCRYTIINFEDARVEIKFGGKYGTKFDLKRSEDCAEDHLTVYDGRYSTDPLIGRYCGHDGEFIVSSGTSLYLEFQSGPGGAPYDYSGFTIKIEERWLNEHEYGRKVPDTLCDWTFLSSDSAEGDLYTPDHMISPGTTCLYTFTGQPGEVLEVTVKAYELKPDCRETIEVLEGDHLLDRICGDRIESRISGATFTFTSKQHELLIRYNTQEKRVSHYKLPFIYYEFKNATDELEDIVVGDPEEVNVAESSDSDGVGYHASTSGAPTWNVMMNRALLMSVIITYIVPSCVIRYS